MQNHKPKYNIQINRLPIIIRGYEKLVVSDELVFRRNGRFLRVAKFVQVTLPLLSFMAERCSITVVLRNTRS